MYVLFKLYTFLCQPAKESKFLTIPNVLTGLRMLAAPYIGYLVFCQDFDWALGLFMAAAVTDSVRMYFKIIGRSLMIDSL